MKNNLWLLIFSFIFLLPAFPGVIKKYEFGDYTSNTLIEKASLCLKESDWKGVDIYTQKCIQLYTGQALRMQKQLKDYPEDNASLSYWALNHVAYSHFLRAEMYTQTAKYKRAYREYEIPVKKYYFSKCFDPSKNSFWKIAQVCQSRMSKMMTSFGKAYFGENDPGNDRQNNLNKKVEMKTKEMRKLPGVNPVN